MKPKYFKRTQALLRNRIEERKTGRHIINVNRLASRQLRSRLTRKRQKRGTAVQKFGQTRCDESKNSTSNNRSNYGCMHLLRHLATRPMQHNLLKSLTRTHTGTYPLFNRPACVPLHLYVKKTQIPTHTQRTSFLINIYSYTINCSLNISNHYQIKSNLKILT